MRRRVLALALITLVGVGSKVYGQLSGAHCFLQGQFLEAGIEKNGALGVPGSPSGYHPRPSSGGSASLCGSSSTRTLASVYDWGHDGWTTGTPAFMGDYTTPGSPWEEWDIEVAGVAKGVASSNSCTSFTGSGALTGGVSGYSATAGRLICDWNGTYNSGNLRIVKEYRIDTQKSALLVTVKLYNVSSSPITGIYYMRTCDPDNNQPITGGAFTTVNYVSYQNDFYHRVDVTARSTGTAAATGTPATELNLGTKDCRAKALWFSSWSLSTSCALNTIWAGGAGCLGSSSMTVNATSTSDIAIGLVFNLGSLVPGDSTVFAYAYIYNYVAGIDEAFPEPNLTASGAIMDTVDTITFCDNAASIIPLGVLDGDDKTWTWGDWTWAPATGLSSTTGISTFLDESAVTSITTYTLTGLANNGSCRQRTILLTVIPISTAPPTVHDTSFCLGATVGSIVGCVTSAAGSLLWYTTATGGTGTTAPPAISTATVGTQTVWVSQTSGGCESARVPINITIAALPVVLLANNGPLCPGDPLTITVTDTSSGTHTYAWTGPGGFTATTMNISKPSCVYADSGVYTLVVNNNGCFTAPATTTVVVHATPPSPVFTNPTYCQYLTSVPLSATGTNVLWYTAATGGTGSAIAPTPSTAVAGVFTFYVTQTIFGCESPRYPVIVTVNAKPGPPAITNSPGEYCPNQNFGTFIVPGGTGTVKWYAAPTGGTGGSTPPTLSTATPGTFYVYATQTVLGCESDRQAIPIVIYDSVKAHFYPVLHRGCTEDTLLLYNTSYGASYYLWTFGDGSSSAAANPTHIYPVQGLYQVTLFAHSLHCLDSVKVNVDTRHPLKAKFGIAPTLACQGSPVAFTDSSIALAPTYTWLFGDGKSSTAVNPSHIYSYIGTYRATQIVRDMIPCYDTAYGTVEVDSLSPITISASDSVFCRGSYITLTADYSTIGEMHMVWNFGNGDSVFEKNPTMYSYPAAGTYTVSATAYYRVCPTATDQFVIHVYDAPNIDLGPDTTICPGNAILALTDYKNAGNPFARWLWSTGQHTSSIGVTTDGTYIGTVTIAGCSASDTVNIKNNCQVVLPNSFTPNMDGVNDYFNPRVFFEKGINTYNLKIYNRWGEVIFESNGVEGRGWDGRFNGVQQPEGVYVYSVVVTFVDGQALQKVGNITLIR